jgi:hypothetical protein
MPIKTSSSTASANLLVLKLIMNFFKHGSALFGHQMSLNIGSVYVNLRPNIQTLQSVRSV